MNLNGSYGTESLILLFISPYVVIPGSDRESSERTTDVLSTSGFPRARE